jgi:nucleotide-binding universal stress UspA family protein
MTDIAVSQPAPAADASPAATLHLVTGYDGSPPATRALGAAAALLRGRHGNIYAVYVAYVPSVDMMSADALAEIEADFGEVEKELRVSAAALLDGRGVTWEFQPRRGLIAAELIAAASLVRDAHPDDTVAIVVGSSSQASHRILGSVAVGLARHCPVPLVIVP